MEVKNETVLVELGDSSGEASGEHVSSLKAQGIEFITRLGIFVCKKKECGCEVKGKRVDFLRHLKRGQHGVMTIQQLEKAWQEARGCLEKFASEQNAGKTLKPTELWKYRKGGWGVGELEGISGLPEVCARKCPTCDKLYEKDEALRHHMKYFHKSGISRSSIRKIRHVKCQSLTRQRKAKNLFRIVSENEERGNMEEEEPVVVYGLDCTRQA